MSRPSWDDYFMEMVQVIASRATCMRRKVGAVLVRDNRILATGYNGAPKNVPHCDKTGCLRALRGVPSGQCHEICRGLHAEQNVLIQAAVYGVSVAGATIYCNTKPCSICTKMLINADIHKIVYMEDYPDALADELLKFTDIRSVHYEKGE